MENKSSSDLTWHDVLGERMLTRKQAAELIGFSPRTIENWNLGGELPYLKVGRKVRITGPQLADFLEQRTIRVRPKRRRALALRKAMYQATSAIMAEYELDNKADINQGFCEQWVNQVLDKLPQEVSAELWWIEDDPRLSEHRAFDIAHCVVHHDGKYYDCLHYQGVKDPLLLVFSDTEKSRKEYKWEMELGPPPHSR